MTRERVGKWKNKSGSPEYYAWRNMRSRCLNESDPSYKNYGCRGIFVCPEWDSFDRFMEDMGRRPDGTTLDRIDAGGGYSKGNCRWATWTVQSLNKRTTRVLASGDKAHEKALASGVKPNTVNARMNRGLSDERVIFPGDLRIPVDFEHGTRRGYEYFRCRCDECKDSNTKRHRVFLETRPLSTEP